ncbi:MAG: hypothetical protein DMD35_16915 [Gemmatimonadetes bacterium]|nr:MAG: hypothetical protein DMD35_16915 [Gemmatimonadota bacterium]
MTVEIVQHVLSIAASLAIILGVVIGLLQLRYQHSLRQAEIAMRLYSSFGEESFVRHYQRVSSWHYPTFASYREDGTADDFTSLMVVSVFFESMGLLLKRGLAPIDLLDDLLSGPVMEAWPQVRPIWVGLREQNHQPSWAEWFEYFYDEMRKRTVKPTDAMVSPR